MASKGGDEAVDCLYEEASFRRAANAAVMHSYIMLRTQISLTEEERRLLDAAAKRTGRSMSALIRDAVNAVYGAQRSSEDELAAMRGVFGSWQDRDRDGAEWVDRLRSGSRVPPVS